MSSPPLRPSHSKNKKSLDAPAGGDSQPIGDDLWGIYQESLGKHGIEPSLDDLDGLRPNPSTIHAALDGVLGTGRTLLPEGHQLYLDLEHLGAQEVPVGGGPKAMKKVIAGSGKAKKLEYLALYEATENAIRHRFTVAQLQRFEKELKIHKILLGQNDSKQKIIHRIMNSYFKMIHPSIIRKELEERLDKIQEFYSVSPSELFILMGRDGGNLLAISKQFNIDISVDREQPAQSIESSTSNDTHHSLPRFLLRASGVKTDHKRLEEYLEGLRKSVATRTVVLPTGPPLSPSRLQDISRTAGAFCENINRPPQDLRKEETSQPLVLITAQDPRSAYTAERLVRRVALEVIIDTHRSQIDLISMMQTDQSISTDVPEPQYSLYPFNTQGFRLQRVKHLKRLPENASLKSLVHFQYRKVKSDHAVDSDEAIVLDDLASAANSNGHGQTEDRVESDLLAVEDDPSLGSMVATSLRGEAVDLRELLFNHERPTDRPMRRVTATFGHVVFKSSGISTLLPPLQGPVAIKPALEWAASQTSSLRSFVLSAIPSLVRVASGPTKLLHRLQYRTVGGADIVDVCVELPTENYGSETPSSITRPNIIGRDMADGFDLVGERAGDGPDETSKTQLGSTEEAEPDDQGQPEPAEPRVESAEAEKAAEVAGPTPLPSEIVAGTETIVEVLLPDSTMDMSLHVLNASPLESSHVPESLKKYLDDLSK
ncbi:hypothetical protein FRC07_008905, partial [Ceratobasidium sp. 392]